jgi:hypothetical protein
VTRLFTSPDSYVPQGFSQVAPCWVHEAEYGDSGQKSAVYIYLCNSKLQIVADCDDVFSENVVEAFVCIRVMNVVGLIEDYNGRKINNVTNNEIDLINVYVLK